MENYEFVLENSEIKIVFNGETHKLSKALIKEKWVLYIHPTPEEMERGIEMKSMELSDEDRETIENLLEQ